MEIKEFLKTDEYALISKMLNQRIALENRDFVKALFITSEYCKDKYLLSEIIDVLDQCYHGYYKSANERCPPKDTNTLLLLMKVSSPYDITWDLTNRVSWGFSAARDYWLKIIENDLIQI
jgi:hypothetical protein